MSTIHITQKMSPGFIDKSARPTYIVHAIVEVDDLGRHRHIDLRVTTGNGREVDNASVLAAARQAILQRLASQVEIQDQMIDED